MHLTWDWLGPASSVATVIALVVTLLYYLYWWPFNLKKPKSLTAKHDPDHAPSRVTLSWKSVSRASNYNIYKTTVKSGVMDVCSSTTNHHIDLTLAPGEAYQYYVIAEDQGRQSPQSDVVPLEVPGKLVQPVGPVDSPIDDSPEAQWPVEDLRRLLVELRQKDNKTVLAILELAASKPDTLVRFPDVCARAGVTPGQGGASIGALTKLIKSLGKTKWPFTHHPDYKVSGEMAERWRQVEAEAKNRK